MQITSIIKNIDILFIIFCCFVRFLKKRKFGESYYLHYTKEIEDVKEINEKQNNSINVYLSYEIRIFY